MTTDAQPTQETLALQGETTSARPVHRGDDRKLSRIERARMPRAVDVLEEVAQSHGVCTRLVAMRRTDLTTGETVTLGVPCGATLASKCPTCADRARRVRMQQCREGWHLDTDPDLEPDTATPDQAELLTYRALLESARADAAHEGDDTGTVDLDESIRAADEDLTAAGVRGHLPHPGDEKMPAKPKRSTRRRQDAPALPFRPVEKTTVGRVFTGNDGQVIRPSTFLTLTLPSYGRVKNDGTPVDPNRYDYRQAARDAIHFPRLLDRFVQNLRRVVGYDVQYFAAVEPQKRLAPHLHAAIRGTFPRALVKQVVAATYHQVWWPSCDEPVYDPNTPAAFPVWDTNDDSDGEGAGRNYLDPRTGEILPTWDEALTATHEPDAEPVHVSRFGTVCDVQGVTTGTRSADKCIGYLTKYLTKSVHECHEPETPAQRAHVDRMCEALRFEPCSERCSNWLLYGVQPQGAKAGMTPGRCPGKAHKRETLGFVGRRVLVSRKWSGKTLTDHRADRKNHVLRTLGAIGRPLPNPDQYVWARADPGEPDTPTRAHLLMRAITDRLAWRQQYQAAQAAAPPDPALSATQDHAA